MEVTQSNLLDLYKERLGKRFRKYGLEVHLSITKVMKYYSSEKGPLKAYAYTVLRNYMKQSYKDNAKIILNDKVVLTPYKLEEDALLLKQDLIKKFSETDYKIFYWHRAEEVPIKMIAYSTGLTVDKVRYRIQRIDSFLEGYMNDRR